MAPRRGRSTSTLDMMPNAVAILVVAILTGLALIHIYWGLGGRAVRAAAVPEVNGKRAFSPSPGGTLFVAACLLAAAYAVAITGHVISSPLAPFARWITFALSLLFLARAIGDFRLVGFFKRRDSSRSARLDTTLYSPLCLVLSLATGYVAYDHV